MEEGGQDLPDDDDGVVGRRRFYYDRMYEGDNCTARRWHWSENAGYFISASFPCGQEPWRTSSEGQSVSVPVDDVALSNQCQTTVNCPPVVTMNHDCSFEPSLETVCAGVEGDGTGGSISAQVPSENLSNKELYCEVDSDLSSAEQNSVIQACVNSSELSEKEKEVVLKAINARN